MTLNSDLAQQEFKSEYLENHSKRNNLHIKGIAESEKETCDEVESKRRHHQGQALPGYSGERVHRVKRRKKKGSANANEPRPNVPSS